MPRYPRVRATVHAFALCVALCAHAWLERPAHSQTNPSGGGLAWSIGYDPATLDPAKVDDQASELVRYLTGGVILRTNRLTQATEP